MKAAVVTGPGKTPVYGEFAEPTAKAGEELVTVRAAALSQLTKVRASGAHYSAAGVFPAVAGSDGVGLTETGDECTSRCRRLLSVRWRSGARLQRGAVWRSRTGWTM